MSSWIDYHTFTSKNGAKINFRFNHTLDYEIWKLKGSNKRGEELKGHPLIGKKFLNKKRQPLSEKDSYGNIGVVEKVFREFIGGWYLRIIVSYNGSHGVYAWENFNSISDIILSGIEENHRILSPIN